MNSDNAIEAIWDIDKEHLTIFITNGPGGKGLVANEACRNVDGNNYDDVQRYSTVRGQSGLTSNGGISCDGVEGPVCHPRCWAPLSEIKRAYRKLAFRLHPDVGDNPDETRFREAREAYEALIEMEQRRPIKVMQAPDRSDHAGPMHVEPRGRPEPIRRRPPVSVIDDFAIVRPAQLIERYPDKLLAGSQRETV